MREIIKLVESQIIFETAEQLDEGMLGDILKKCGIGTSPANGEVEFAFANGEERTVPMQAAKVVAAFAQRNPNDYDSPSILWQAIKSHLSSTAQGGKEVLGMLAKVLGDSDEDWGGIA